MELPIMMSEKEIYKTKMEVENYNRLLEKSGRKVKNTLGKDDFLKLLVVQLENQDPTRPLDDKEFIGQMAQFSSLEQMAEINKTLSNMITNYKINLSYSLLGREVEVLDKMTGQTKSGLVKDVSFEFDTPTIYFNGFRYSIDDVTRVSIMDSE